MLNNKIEEYFKNPRKMIKVETDNNYKLLLTFDNDENKFYSMANELNGVFSVLRNKKISNCFSR